MNDERDDVVDRRPLTSRDTGWAQALARAAAARGIAPNAISAASVVCAAVAAFALWRAASTGATDGALWLLVAALGCQLRLICNLIDGMVAIEGGRASATGALWNELPDRLSDALILAGAGLMAHSLALGCAAAAASIVTAYVRELGHRLTGVADFSGWMAKPQRMALITLACAVAIVLRLLGASGDTVVFAAALSVVLLGAVWVSVARTRRLIGALELDDQR